MLTIDMQDTNRRGACAAPAVDEKPEAACALSGGSAAGTDVCREFRAGSAGFLGRRADCLPTGQLRFRPVNSPPDAQRLPLHRLPDSWRKRGMS